MGHPRECLANRTYVRYRHPVRFEVEVRVGLPLDSTARQFVGKVASSAKKFVACPAEEGRMVVTDYLDATDEVGTKSGPCLRWIASSGT